MTALKKIIDTVLQWFSIAVVAVMLALITYQVVTRYFFNQPSAVSEALARYLFVWLTMLGGAYVFGKREHMNLAFIHDKFPRRGQIILEMASELLIAAFAAGVMIGGGRIYALKQMTSIDPSINIPMGVIYLSLPVGGVLILFYCICNEVMLAKKLRGVS